MRDRLAPCLVLALVVIAAADAGCGGHGSKVLDPGCRFTGITSVDADGNPAGGADPDDWCPATVTASAVSQPAVSDTVPTPPPSTWLGPAYPNPSVGSVQILFSVPDDRAVRIEIIAPGCRHVATLVDRVQVAGVHAVTWGRLDDSGQTVAAGIYRCTMTAGDFSCHGDIQLLPAAQ